LTTHNNRANAINEKEIKKLKGKTYKYKAVIEGKFSEYAYPTKEQLELKKGSQVMFIKNDSSIEKLFYNGKIGKITSIAKNKIYVLCPGDDEEIEVQQETWENTTYTIDQETKEITSDQVGSFTQIPLRLAWAITIHKSQGLTFEKAIIDAEASFAHGQTYVALSRCKSLEGIVLKTRIKSSSIISDSQVDSFTKNVEENQPDETVLSLSKKEYELSLVADLFNYYEFTYPLKKIIDLYYKNAKILKGNILDVATNLKEQRIPELMKVSHSFQRQVISMSANMEVLDKDKELQERLQKAIVYFTKFTMDELQAGFDSFLYSTDNKQVKKDIKTQLDKLDELVSAKLFCLKGLSKKFTVSKYLELRTKAVFEKTKKSKTTSEKVGFTSSEHPALFQSLKELRQVLSEEEGVKPFQVFTQNSLFEMCSSLPKTLKSLASIQGMGKKRVKKYGKQIVEVIQDYLSKKEHTKTKTTVKKSNKSGKSSTNQITYEMFIKGKTIEEIAEERGYVRTTIEGHLALFVASGDLEVSDIMTKERYDELKAIMKNTEYDSFADLKGKIDSKFRYSELRLVAQELGRI